MMVRRFPAYSSLSPSLKDYIPHYSMPCHTEVLLFISIYTAFSVYISHTRNAYKLQEILSFVFVSFHFIHLFCQQPLTVY